MAEEEDVDKNILTEGIVGDNSIQEEGVIALSEVSGEFEEALQQGKKFSRTP